jgi:hypothetical protein
MAPYTGDNAGHVLGDDIYSLFATMLEFDSLDRDNQILLTGYTKFDFQFGGVSIRPPLTLRDYWNQRIPKGEGVGADGRRSVCFRRFITGYGMLGFGNRLVRVRPMNAIAFACRIDPIILFGAVLCCCVVYD